MLPEVLVTSQEPSFSILIFWIPECHCKTRPLPVLGRQLANSRSELGEVGPNKTWTYSGPSQTWYRTTVQSSAEWFCRAMAVPMPAGLSAFAPVGVTAPCLHSHDQLQLQAPRANTRVPVQRKARQLLCALAPAPRTPPPIATLQLCNQLATVTPVARLMSGVCAGPQVADIVTPKAMVMNTPAARAPLAALLLRLCFVGLLAAAPALSSRAAVHVEASGEVVPSQAAHWAGTRALLQVRLLARCTPLSSTFCKTDISTS